MRTLDADLVREAASCEGLRVDTVDETGSTNQVLMEAAFGPDAAPPRLLAAARQTAGRGRRGRAWLTPEGRSVALSIAFERRALREPPPVGVSVAVGVAAAQALLRWAPDLRLKWPNDLLRAGSKLGGVLVECRRSQPAGAADGSAIERIVVGIGVNLLAPDDAASIPQPACGLFDDATLPANAAETVIGILAGSVVPAVRRFLVDGLAPFAAAWRRFDALEGETVALVDGEHVLATGRALGLDDSGGLRLLTPDGLRVLSSGEVSIRRLDAVRRVG